MHAITSPSTRQLARAIIPQLLSHQQSKFVPILAPTIGRFAPRPFSDLTQAQKLNSAVDLKSLRVDPQVTLPSPTRYPSGAFLDEVYVKTDFENLCLKNIQSSFGLLPADPYVPGSGRHKGIARFTVEGNVVKPQKNGPVFQSSDYNPLAGDINREYTECPKMMLEDKTLHALLKHVAKIAHLPEGEEILLHAQRTITTPHVTGLPTAEGWHQDGLEIVAIFCVNRDNIEGGINYLAKGKGTDIFLEHNLLPGEMITISDQDCFHYVSPMNVKDSSKKGVRDVFVFVCPSMRPSNT